MAFGEGDDRVVVYHNRMVYADGNVQFWMQNATSSDGNGGSVLIPDISVVRAIRNRPVAVLNNMDGPLIRWTSANTVAVVVPRGAGAS